MWNVMFETPQMEKAFFEALQYKSESGGLLFISSEPVFGGRRLFQRAFHVRNAPFFIRSYITTNNAAKQPKTSYSPENLSMMIGIANQTIKGRFRFAIPWHSHPAYEGVWPSIADWNHWWAYWKVYKSAARGVVVNPLPENLTVYDFGVQPNGKGALGVTNIDQGHFRSWDLPELREVRKLFKANKVN